MLCSVYTTIAGEYDGPGFCTPIGEKIIDDIELIIGAYRLIYS